VAIGVTRGADADVFVPVRSWACRSCPHVPACEAEGSDCGVRDAVWGASQDGRFPFALRPSRGAAPSQSP